MADNDKNDLSTKKRCVFLTGDIDEEKSEKFISQIMKLEVEDPLKDIMVFINSYGGYLHDMWAMIDVMNLVSCNVHTLCAGKAMSAGSLVLANGTKGNRYCTPHSNIMIHQISGGTAGTHTEVQIYQKEMLRMQEELEGFLLSKTKITKTKMKQFMKVDTYITPQEALKLGLVDKIITDFSEVKFGAMKDLAPRKKPVKTKFKKVSKS